MDCTCVALFFLLASLRALQYLLQSPIQPTNTHSNSQRGQFTVQYLVQGHVNTWTEGAGDWTIDFLIGLAIPYAIWFFHVIMVTLAYYHIKADRIMCGETSLKNHNVNHLVVQMFRHQSHHLGIINVGTNIYANLSKRCGDTVFCSITLALDE